MTIVVTGATGNVGAPLVRALLDAGAKVRTVSRGDGPQGVPHVRADLSSPDGLRAAFDGAEALFLLVSGAGAHVDAGALLAAGGFARVVLLSSQAAGTRPESASHAPLRAIEAAVRQHAPQWTILRPGGFHTNAFAWAESVRTTRTVAAPFGDVGLPSVDPADIAGVAAAALLDDGHAGRVYELTGPAAVTPRERAGAIAEALGEPVRFVEQSVDEARAQLSRFMPEAVVEGTLAILGTPTAAERRISPDVATVLGRPAGSFADWARRAVEAFR
ncbi:NmrA family transcriptional regulator [Virgisporangium aliadipatigenens]|uniref:NmrA family transcriptional regulator n=1 Tax=Virgisporangium aliadipatigenens TaxID=741659 RepID=A0A8J3YHD0_9ACTN|nr:NAD(P)H-binding protein [Virgisporangium aliadipatigenens]GIJ45259.1 NmrA family transcriptional regulator [Virgisporangium aliadipatigenens]